MKKLAMLFLACFSLNTYAAKQCSVDIKNEVHLDGSQVEIYQEESAKVLIDEDNNVFINGKKLDLNQVQRDAIESYREHMNEYVPKAKEIARDGLALAQSALDDIAKSFDNSEAFNNVKEALQAFFGKVENHYQKEDQFVLQEAAFGNALETWKEDLSAAKETFNAEFFSSAFTAMSEQMKEEGGFNLTEMKAKMVELQANLKTKLKTESKAIEKDAVQYCEDLEKIAEEEKMLHEKIPELKDYKVFLI
jgi:hypothetical protein